MNRGLTGEERRLVRWMLENGEPGAREFLSQLDLAEVTPWRCKCGCASINFEIKGHPVPPGGGIRPIADFLLGDGSTTSGIFVYEKHGVLAGVDVHGLAGDAPKYLPTPEMLRPW